MWGGSYQGIALAVPLAFEVRCPFKGGWAINVLKETEDGIQR
jgi:hypothetical protein